MVIEVATDNEPHGVDRLIGDLRRWAADARASDAARARSRQRWLRRQAEEESTLAGIALNLAERGTAVGHWAAWTAVWYFRPNASGKRTR